jgi:hypothetical protein
MADNTACTRTTLPTKFPSVAVYAVSCEMQVDRILIGLMFDYDEKWAVKCV